MTNSGTDRVERKLAAIFCADVADYSRLMHADETGTMRALTAHRAIMDGLIAAHGGRIANTAGDSVLAEFPSVIDAVECAIAVQGRLGETNAGVVEETALRFRIGVHVGDVMVRGGDLLGDGVNVAARVQALADPGGVWITGRAYEEVEGKLSVGFEDRGEQQVKNIARPIKVYALSGVAPSRPDSKALSLPDKPSIAVLPFTNMSGDPEQDYFCDGLVEDIITALSRVKWFFVIARNSSFTYKGRAVDIRQVGRELGVRYVLEGSIRKAGGRLRITGQLIEAETGNHVWAERFDGTLHDVFDLQDRVTESVARAIEPNVRLVEIARAKAKPTESLGAYDLYLRASAELYDWNAESFRQAEQFLRRAIEQDGNYSEALATLALCVGNAGFDGWKPVDAALQEGLSLARRAAHLDNASAEVLAAAAYAEAFFGGSYDRSEESAIQALQLNSNSARVLNLCGAALAFCYAGVSELAIEQLEAARRVNPVDPRGYAPMVNLGAAHFWAKRFEETVSWMRRVLAQQPNHNIAKRYLAAALAHLGRIEEAREVIADLLRSQPNSSLSRSRQSRFKHPWQLALYVEGLRLAGLPE